LKFKNLCGRKQVLRLKLYKKPFLGKGMFAFNKCYDRNYRILS
jgi:hypothetical protein